MPDPTRPTPPALADAPVVAHVTRGGVVESVHRGSIAVTQPDGTLAHAWGAPDDPVFPRSSNKPLQAVAMLRAGLVLPPHHLALACASHSAEPFHLDAVRDMLAAVGLTEADLQNTPDLPYDPDERDVWIAAGRTRPAARPELLGQARGDARHLPDQRLGPAHLPRGGPPVAVAHGRHHRRPRRRAGRGDGRRRVRRPGHGDLPGRARPRLRAGRPPVLREPPRASSPPRSGPTPSTSAARAATSPRSSAAPTGSSPRTAPSRCTPWG